ncbi:SPOR domain-containing protein [Thiomicrorhabdus cannonii]|uniref:SPOR domain-containing protein n=1 Tax=Thiomicrorhabdus cannonii TaxID=2748011 RepID=UPI0015B7B379|nr:SPOR domain-containing protein [Thiomicrorhabdus cannonii]
MAQTIADLEKERAELLKAIESQAQQLSSTRTDDAQGHSLSDWLNAAEEIMPNSTRTASKTPPSQTAQTSAEMPRKPTSNKTSFFGVIILLTLLLTILGVLYIAYTTINKELQEVKVVKEQTQAEMQRLQQSMDELQKNLASGGQPEMFAALEERVGSLENVLADMQSQQQAMLKRLDAGVVATAEKPFVAPTESVKSETAGDQVVTEAILDEKLKAYTTQLEKRIDQKLETILQHLLQGGSAVKVLPKTDEETDELRADAAEAIISPAAPSEPKVPVMAQPILKLVQPVAKTAEPEKAIAAPVVDASSVSAPALSADENWLQQQPAQHYTLQLASMADKQALEKMVAQKGIGDSRIVMQKRLDDVRYVLLTGSYANKADAAERAKQVKETYGISPWVRKVKDLTVKLPQ